MYYFLQEQIDSAWERFAIRIQAHSMHPYRNPLSLHISLTIVFRTVMGYIVPSIFNSKPPLSQKEGVKVYNPLLKILLPECTKSMD